MAKLIKSQANLTMIDLFAGCGGLSLGFENAGFVPVFVNELNKDALDTYLTNRHHNLGGMSFSQNKDLHCNDAHDLKGKRLEKLISDLRSIGCIDFQMERGTASSGAGSTLDVLAGGPPCQGYSGIGIRRSYDVHRKDIPSNYLYGRMTQIIRKLRPRIFLFENVRGLLNARWTKNGNDLIWPDVKAEFCKIAGYDVRWSLVYSKYYGVPQNRPRVLLVGIRKDISRSPLIQDLICLSNDPEDAVSCGFLPQPAQEEYPDLQDLLGDLEDPEICKALRQQRFPKGGFVTEQYPKAPLNSVQEKLRAVPSWYAHDNVALTDHEYSRHSRSVVQKFDYMLKNKGEIPPHLKTKKFSQRLLPKRWDVQGPNITATSLPDDYVHYSQPRILTVREWARLQLFPDWYRFSGKRTTGGIRRAGNPKEGIFDREVPKYTQIGNAVPVELSERVARHFRLILDKTIYASK